MKLRITRPELFQDPTCGGYKDTTCRNGKYTIVGGPQSYGDTVEECVQSMLKNEFLPGECVDVEEHFGKCLGRFRINHRGVLVKLPPTPTGSGS